MIEVDYRIGSINLLPLITALSVPATEAHLDSADFAFWGNGPNEAPIRIGIERKTVPDLLDSLRSERFVGGQLPTLLADHARVYLFVEGPMRRSWREEGMIEYRVESGQKEQGGGGFSDWTTGFGNGVNWYYVMARLASLEEIGVRVRRPATMSDTAAQVVSLYQWWNKPYAEHSSHHAVKHVEVALRKAGPVAKVARALDLGHDAARRAEAQWPTVYDMVVAKAEEWLESGVVKSKGAVTKVMKKIYGGGE